MEMNKLKKIVYPIAIFLAGVSMFVYSYEMMAIGWFYAVCWAIESMAAVFAFTRIAMHMVYKDNAPKTWQVSILWLVVAGGWLGAILCDTVAWMNIWLAVTSFALISVIWARFFLKDEDKNGVFDIFEKDKKKEVIFSADYLYKEMIFKPKGDDLKNPPDPTKPLCQVNSQAMTVVEARQAGYTEIAAAGMDYIDKLLVAYKGKGEHEK